MAYYAALVSTVQLLKDILSHDPYPNLQLTRQTTILKSLHEKFNLLEESLQDFTSNDCVEERIRDVADRAQDIIDSEISKQILSEKWDNEAENVSGRVSPLEKIRGKKSIYHRLFYACQNAFHRKERSEMQEEDAKYVKDLKLVQQELGLVVEEVIAIKENQRIQSSKLNHGSFDPSGTAKQGPIGGSVMVGFDGYLTTIKEQLCGQSSRLRVIPIVGMGGIGKTTLARNIFDDALVSYYFDHRVWVTVSPNYDENRVLQSIEESMALTITSEAPAEGEDSTELMINNESLGRRGEETLREKIYKSLKGRRYLIVFDDVWSTKVWEDVNQIFPDDRNGSRIVLTTRLLDIAQYAGNCGCIHEMQFLNEEQSWDLLQERVFADKHCPPELENTGKFIASKCHGLPLAIVVIAGILSNVETPNSWKNIATHVREIFRTHEDFSGILSLSYSHLSHQLKACFLYMGSFPEGYEIKVSKLIKLWIAEGFLKSSNNESKSLERVAEECLEDLVKRNLVLITKRRSNGDFKSCILHDLLKVFCRQRASHESFSHVMDEKGGLYPRGIEMVRRVNLDRCLLHEHNSKCLSKSIRSILVFGDDSSESCGNIKWERYGNLVRVLDIAEMASSSTPTAIYKMFHLKYIGLYLRNDYLRNYLPSSISVLRNLQTLVIDSDTSFNPVILPPQIWKMTQLRHVIIRSLILPYIPTASDDVPVHKLGYLQTLMTLLNFRFTEKAIEIIPGLKKLKIECWGNELCHTWEFYGLYNLVRLLVLEELKINFYGSDSLQSQSLPPNFAFTVNLRKLTLRGCMLPWKDLTVVGLLPNLHVLKLREQSFVGEEWKPTEGEFDRLKFLMLESLDIRYWRAENFHFPRLESLKICCCFALEIPLEIGDIPTLKLIHVSGSQTTEASVILIWEEQQSLGNEVLQVHVDRR